MKTALAAAALLALAGCNGAADKAAPPPANAVDPAPVAATQSRQIGETSALTGQTSALTGAVTDFSVTVTDAATIVALATDTLFAFDKAELAPNAVADLERTAELIRAAPPGTIAITGHSDAKGDDAYNQSLSQRRAEAVAAWLRGQDSLKGWTFTTTGKGETAPVAPNTKPDGSDDPAGRARNRRVEVTIPKR